MDRTQFKQRMESLKSYREQNPGKGYWDWRNSLPDNLKHTDDSEYDMRAAYESGAQPILEDDGLYHLPSRDPRTGRILKKSYHNTYWKALSEDAKLGYEPYWIVDDTYTSKSGDTPIQAFQRGGEIGNNDESVQKYKTGGEIYSEFPEDWDENKINGYYQWTMNNYTPSLQFANTVDNRLNRSNGIPMESGLINVYPEYGIIGLSRIPKINKPIRKLSTIIPDSRKRKDPDRPTFPESFEKFKAPIAHGFLNESLKYRKRERSKNKI